MLSLAVSPVWDWLPRRTRSRGASLGLWDLSRESLSKAASEIGSNERILAHQVDITNRSSLRAFLQDTKQGLGKIDGIANIAGTGGHKLGNEDVWETDDEESDFVMNVNVKGIFHILSEALNQESWKSQEVSSTSPACSQLEGTRKVLCSVLASTRLLAWSKVLQSKLEGGEFESML